jgi:hypothetical protein
MKRLTRMFVAAASGLLLVGSGASFASASGTQSLAPPGTTVVARLLNNPRQLSLLQGDGVLLVAEAGKGGSQCELVEGEGGEEEEFCVGTTGAIRSVSTGGKWKPKRIVKGLLSGAGPDGSFAVGSDGVSARHLNSIFLQETFFGPDAKPAFQNGALLRQTPGQRLNRFADITGFEEANDPDGQGFDSNPYSVLSLYKRTLVADAAANAILSVDPKGNVTLFKVLPNITTGLCAGVPNDAGTTGCDPVPTSLAQGPNGHIYVGGLAGLTPGEGSVWELDPSTGAILNRWRGFTAVTGVAVGKDGSVYASELFGGDPDAEIPGQVTKIAPNGTRTSVVIPFPAGLAVDSKNRVYVSAFSTSPGTGLGVPGIDTSGQIWRLRI